MTSNQCVYSVGRPSPCFHTANNSVTDPSFGDCYQMIPLCRTKCIMNENNYTPARHNENRS